MKCVTSLPPIVSVFPSIIWNEWTIFSDNNVHPGAGGSKHDRGSEVPPPPTPLLATKRPRPVVKITSL